VPLAATYVSWRARPPCPPSPRARSCRARRAHLFVLRSQGRAAVVSKEECRSLAVGNLSHFFEKPKTGCAPGIFEVWGYSTHTAQSSSSAIAALPSHLPTLSGFSSRVSVFPLLAWGHPNISRGKERRLSSHQWPRPVAPGSPSAAAGGTPGSRCRDRRRRGGPRRAAWRRRRVGGVRRC